MNAIITTTARYLPNKVLSNVDLENMVDTSDSWIQSRTGIKERRIAAKDEATSDMASKIGFSLLAKSGKSAKEIDVIIIATCTPDMPVVATAALVQNNIGATNAWGFDLMGACTGFIFALETGAKLVESKKYKTVMIIGVDTMSSIIDYTDRNTCIIFGDGGGGVLLEPSTGNQGILDSILHLDGKGGEFLNVPAGGSRNPASDETVANHEHFVSQDGKSVYRFAVRNMADVSAEIMKKNGINGKDLKLFIPHQANKRIIDASRIRCNLDEDQVLVNIQNYGNTTAGTIPIGLDEAVEQGRIQSNDLVLLAAFGGGFTWGSMLIRWGP